MEDEPPYQFYQLIWFTANTECDLEHIFFSHLVSAKTKDKLYLSSIIGTWTSLCKLYFSYTLLLNFAVQMEAVELQT
jgi:hypothetical protein